jgi:aflatoxin B1 aldehyde reductase
VVACRRYGLDIVIYNPSACPSQPTISDLTKTHRLAGGFFTGKYKPTPDPGTEVGSLSTTTEVGKVYQENYFNDAYFRALELISPVIASNNLTPVEVGLRWVVHHSALNILDGNDGIIVGTSSVKQLKETLDNIEKGPLPEEVLKVLDEAWEITRSSCPTYWHLALKYGYDFDEK